MSLTLIRKILWVATGVVALVLVWLLLWSDYRFNRAQTENEPPFVANFELTDHQGTVRTEKDFEGRWMLIFFGFTNCPDICPTTLAEIAAVMKELGDESTKVQPIFISIDPERDTPAILAEYVPLFDAPIIGLTGTPEQIAETSRTFPIFYERIEEATATNGYTMAHTSHLFLFGTKAGFADSWPYGTPAEEILADLRKKI